jgi:type II secretory pathway component PulC
MRRSLLFVFLFAGCVTVGGKPDPAQPLLDESREGAGSPTPPPGPAQAAPTARRSDGVIARPELLSFLEAAPGAFLQHVDSEPRFRGGRFAGWKVVAFYPGDKRFAGVDLQAGDVVIGVNGSPVERPEQLMQVWQELRTSKELVVDLERAGTAHTLRWVISP